MDRPVRILHVAVNMNRGGAETLLMNLYRNIDRSKIQFDFLTCKPGVFDDEITQLGGHVYRIPYVTDSGHTAYIQALETFFQAHRQYHVVHSHMDKLSGFVLRAAAKASIPYRIAHSHNTSSEGGFGAKLYKELAGMYISKYATHYVACSHKAASWLFKRKAHKALILKNGIECSKFSFSSQKREAVRLALDIPINSIVLGHIGRFNHQKNHEFLIDVLNETVKEHKNTILLLVGDGELQASIRRKTERLNLQKHVRFLGVRNDVHHLLQAFDVFVFPSHHEGLPVTLIEAQGAGLPCIISQNITREVDMGLNAIRYLPISETKCWVEAIHSLRTNQTRHSNPIEALTKMGYDIQSSAKMTENLYGSMVGS